MLPKTLMPDRPKPPVVFECTGCLISVNSRDHHIPVGWSQHREATWCPDCSTSAEARASGGHAARNRTAIK